MNYIIPTTIDQIKEQYPVNSIISVVSHFYPSTTYFFKVTRYTKSSIELQQLQKETISDEIGYYRVAPTDVKYGEPKLYRITKFEDSFSIKLGRMYLFFKSDNRFNPSKVYADYLD